MADYIGWGSVPWSEGSWGVDLIEVPLVGESLSLGLGDVDARVIYSVYVTGESLSLGLGDVSLSTNNYVAAQGESLALGLGVPVARGAANVRPDGVQLTLSLQDPLVWGEIGFATTAWGAIPPPTTVTWSPVVT